MELIYEIVIIKVLLLEYIREINYSWKYLIIHGIITKKYQGVSLLFKKNKYLLSYNKYLKSFCSERKKRLDYPLVSSSFL